MVGSTSARATSGLSPLLAESVHMVNVQIFGLKNPQATRAAERFFKERRATIQFVDLKQKSIAPGEIKRFIERFGLTALVDHKAKRISTPA